MSKAVVKSARPPSDSSGQRLSVPLLTALFDAQDLRQRVWVDLGRAQGGLAAHLSGQPARLLVADLPRARLDGNPQWFLPGSVLPPNCWRESADRFLCWDLLNYMAPDELNALSSCIAHHASTDCRIHALIQYSGTLMSAQPGRFTLDDNLELTLAGADSENRASPRYSPKALEKSMPELRVERTLLLNNGMQEFMFSVR